MKTLPILSGVTYVSLFLAAMASAEILGVQPGTSSNPKDNVPKEIQRDTPSGPGGSGPGSRGDALAGGMEKEKPHPVTRQELEQNAAQGGGAAVEAEILKEKSERQSKHP
jgi:hypothetical protein